jgi:hypothetical protein
MSRTDTAVRAISASPDRVSAADRLRRACRVATAGRMTGRFKHLDALLAGPTDWSWRTRTRRPRGKAAVDSDVADAMGGHPVDVRSRVDIRADDVPDGINAADHAAGLSSSLDNLAASVER